MFIGCSCAPAYARVILSPTLPLAGAQGARRPSYLSGKSVERFSRDRAARGYQSLSKTPARKTEIRERIQRGIGCPVAKPKIFFFAKIRNHALTPVIPPRAEGRCASSRTRGGLRWMRDAARRAAQLADGEDVWSWHPLAGAKSDGDDRQTTVTKKSWTPGRARSKPLTPIAQGGPD